MKILTIVGARPQFVKAATISRVVREKDNLSEVIIHTGQHFDENMSSVFFNEMDIPEPDYNLGINSMSHGAMTGRMLEGVEKIMEMENPDWVLVYGDTNSTLAGALGASKLGIKLAHVEAGLRSYNMNMPEEINRILTDRVSNVLFCPTDKAVDNLQKEGYNNLDVTVINVGDVMLDAALYYKKRTRLNNINLPSNFILTTIHRAENTNSPDKLKNIIEAFNEINKTIPVVLPLHPRTKNYIKKYNLTPKFRMIPPVGYLEMIDLLENCSLVMTDSGGVQKEAYFFRKPCLTLRTETEWVELVNMGFNRLVDTNSKINIINALKVVRENKIHFTNESIYGDGNAAKRIVEHLIDHN